jgi:plasmid stabilization system protein ParE
MSGYILHLEAYADMDEIWDFIAQDNLDAADRVRDGHASRRVSELLRSPGHFRIEVESE